MEDQIYRIDAEGDTVYLRATSLQDAYSQLQQKIGPIPKSMLTFTEVDEVPEGEELL